MNTYLYGMAQSDPFRIAVQSFLLSNGISCGPKDKATFTVVLGGDGTVLGAGREGVPNPIVVINTGHLGFLTSGDKENYQDILLRFLNGSYTLTKRRTLRVRVGQQIFDAMNEVVIAKNQLSKLVKIAVYVSDRDVTWKSPEFLSEYRADGLIVSTPTGSTAYNVSAGGPIIHPSCDTFVITPICPQGLTQRPLVIPAHMKLYIAPLDDSDLYVSVDGQSGCPMKDRLDVAYNSHNIETVNPPDTYFQILREKLGWGIKPV